MFGCAAVVTVPAVVAVDALPDRAPAKVVAVTVPPLDELVPLLKFVAVPAVVAVDALPDNAPENVVAVTVPPELELVPLLKFVAVVAVDALPVVL